VKKPAQITPSLMGKAQPPKIYDMARDTTWTVWHWIGKAAAPSALRAADRKTV